MLVEQAQLSLVAAVLLAILRETSLDFQNIPASVRVIDIPLWKVYYIVQDIR